jgi:putative peptide zinc metalloprotease protein
MVVTKKTLLSLHPLKIQKDKINYIVENEATSEFYEMPEVCISAIELINQKKPLDDVEKELIVRYPDENIDILNFISQLLELNLISELDGEAILSSSLQKNHSGFCWIPQTLGQLFFNSISSKLYVLLLVASIGLVLFKPELFPHYSDLFMFNLIFQNIIALLLISFLLVILHEFGHVLAVRSEGLPAKIEVGNRLFFVVLETDMSQVWKLPAERRNKLYLAGMYLDIVVLFLALLAQLFMSENSLAMGLMKMVVLNTFIRLIFQAAVFMKTDLYYVLENTTGCYNLMENGRNFLAKWLPFLRVREAETFAGEEKFVRRYAGFYLSGILLTLIITAYYYIPQMIFAVNEIMLPGFLEPVTSIRFWDSIVFLLQILLVLGLLIYSWSKKYRLSS